MDDMIWREIEKCDFCYHTKAIFDTKASSVICKCRYLSPLLFWHCKVDFVTAAKLPPGFADRKIKVVTAEFTLQLEICVCSFNFAFATVIFQTEFAFAALRLWQRQPVIKQCEWEVAWGETRGASSSDLCLNELMKISTHTKILACSQRRVYCYPFWETIGASSADLFAFLLPGCSNLARSVLLYVRRFRAGYYYVRCPRFFCSPIALRCVCVCALDCLLYFYLFLCLKEWADEGYARHVPHII